MKGWMALTIGIAAAFSLVGCGGSGTEERLGRSDLAL
jgi:hypothetical protein